MDSSVFAGRSSLVWRWLALLLAISLLGAACGGDDDAGGDPAPEVDGGSDAGAEVVEEAVREPAGGAVDGALVSVLTFDFGMWALDPSGGEPFEVVVPDVGFADRQAPALATPDASTAVVLVYTTVEGQTFSNHVGVGAIDLATGEGRLVAELGQDRADDESTDVSSWEIVGISDTTAWITENGSDLDGEALLAVDIASGAVATAVEATESRVRGPVVLDGTLYGQVEGTISRLGDDGWETVAVLNDLGFDEFVSPATIDDFAITRSGAPVDEEWASSMLTFFDPRPTSAGMAGAGGSLYWQFNENWSNAEGTDSAIVGGFVQFDPGTAQITGVWPLGESVGAFTGENEISTSSQGSWHTTGGTVWFADARDDGDLLRLDPASGVEAFDIAPVDGADYTRIEVLPNDPDGVWLILEDWTITESDDTGTSSTGRTRFVLVDQDTGALELEIIESDLIGF